MKRTTVEALQAASEFLQMARAQIAEARLRIIEGKGGNQALDFNLGCNSDAIDKVISELDDYAHPINFERMVLSDSVEEPEWDRKYDRGGTSR